MPLVEAARVAVKWTVDRVHDRHGDAVGHSQRGEPGVIVPHVKWMVLCSLEVDLLPCAGDMI
jgi:hypothetical protein